MRAIVRPVTFVAVFCSTLLALQPLEARPRKGPPLVPRAKASEGPSEAEAWIAGYYRDPSPEQLEARLRQLSKAGALAKASATGPLTSFLAEVMKANPARVTGWLKALQDLPGEEHEILVQAAWRSGAESGKQWLQEKGRARLLATSPPNLLDPERPLDDAALLDQLWGMFLATGAEAPVLRVIAALELSKHQGALKRYEASAKTPADKTAAVADAVFEAAMWSLESNARQHPRVLAILERAFEQKTLGPRPTLYTGLLLTKLRPRVYRATYEDGITIHVEGPEGSRAIRFRGTK